MENKPAPTCPYCGEEMKIDGVWVFPFYRCPKCRSTSPLAQHANANDEAYEAAMRRADRPKGKWIYTKSGYIECSMCGHADCNDTCFCPNCGADMSEDSDAEL